MGWWKMERPSEGVSGKRWRVRERRPRSPETRASAGEEIDEAADQ
jgi:hypothetical protein